MPQHNTGRQVQQLITYRNGLAVSQKTLQKNKQPVRTNHNRSACLQLLAAYKPCIEFGAQAVATQRVAGVEIDVSSEGCGYIKVGTLLRFAIMDTPTGHTLHVAHLIRGEDTSIPMPQLTGEDQHIHRRVSSILLNMDHASNERSGGGSQIANPVL